MWEEIWKNAIGNISKTAPIGDFVECGSYNGFSAKILAANCKQTLHLFDSWQGISKLSEFDNKYYETQKWICNLEDIQNNLSGFDNIKYYKGWYPDKFGEVDKEISLLHIDASIYHSTKLSLEYFWPKLIKGGYLIVNFHEDYSTGAKKAVLEKFDESQLEVYPLGIRLIVK
jgi:O-methyltransferase